jgi:very-short-patch-repair endonuclease
VAYERDVHRYTAFGRLGWLVLRFTLEDVLDRPDYVLDVLRDVLEHLPPVW